VIALAHAPRNRQRIAGDPTRLVRRQEHRDRRLSTTEGPSVPVLTGIGTVELPMLKEPVVALMGAGFLKQGFVDVVATRAFQDSTTRGLDSRLASLHERLLNGHRQTAIESTRKTLPKTHPG
jgi:hypothetical protein